MTNKLKVGIVGCGFVGGALKQWLEEHNKNCSVLVSDPPKGMNDDLSVCDVIFVSIHIPTEVDGSQDLSLLKSILTDLPDVPIYIRTTLLPKTTGALKAEIKKDINFMPEFLTERTAYQDFSTQPLVFTNHIELMKSVFVNREYVEMSSLEAELAKYAHNVFGALKVTYFNGVYKMAQELECDYDNIKKGVLLSGYINQTHTSVPGPDGSLGYGGKCFPKDVNAFIDFNENNELGNLLKVVKTNNDMYRK